MAVASSAKTLQSIAQQFESIDAYLEAVHEILGEGHLPNIADLKDRIECLCNDVENAPLEIQSVCIKKLNDLLEKLNNCENAMTSFQLVSAESAIK